MERVEHRILRRWTGGTLLAFLRVEERRSLGLLEGEFVFLCLVELVLPFLLRLDDMYPLFQVLLLPLQIVLHLVLELEF